MKKYTILRIYEQDFGCEGLPEGQECMVDVVLQAEDKSEITVQISEAELDARKLAEGDTYWME